MESTQLIFASHSTDHCHTIPPSSFKHPRTPAQSRFGAPLSLVAMAAPAVGCQFSLEVGLSLFSSLLSPNPPAQERDRDHLYSHDTKEGEKRRGQDQTKAHRDMEGHMGAVVPVPTPSQSEVLCVWKDSKVGL